MTWKQYLAQKNIRKNEAMSKESDKSMHKH